MTQIAQTGRKKSFNSRVQLHVLLRITQAINNNFSATELFKIFEFVLEQQLGISRFAFCSQTENGWEWVATGGIEPEVLDRVRPEFHLLPFSEINVISGSALGDITGFEIIIPVHHKKQPLAFIMLGKSGKRRKQSTKNNHIDFIQTISNVIAVAIENKRLAREAVQQEVFRRELEMAGEVQNMLMPNRFFSNRNLEMATKYKPQKQIGGDYLDYIPLNRSEALFCMADVSGKGISAALLMANFQGFLHALIKPDIDLIATIQALNEQIIEIAQGERFITMFIGKFNFLLRSLEYVNAGHNPPVWYHQDKVDLLQKGCVGLGMLDEIPKIESGLIYFNRGDIITCYTDGLVEQENEQGIEFGADKLSQMLEQHHHLSAHEINTLLVSTLEQYKGKKPFLDDIALLSFKFF